MFNDCNNHCNTNLEPLQDKKNGKVIRWQQKKKYSIEISESFRRIGQEMKSVRMLECGSVLDFKVYENGEKDLHHAIFCKARLCPMCAWRRSLKIFHQVSRVMDYIESENGYRYIFLTLTARNVSADVLSSEIDKLLEAFKKLISRKEFKRLSKGWFRALEVTKNWEENTYHPHFHVIIAVNKTYFNDPTIYLSHEKWVAIWLSCLSVNYDPIVNIKAFKEGVDRKGIAEASKYAVKFSNLVARYQNGQVCEQYTDEAIETVDVALKGRRLIAFGGLFKDVCSLLKLDDAENGDLVNTDSEELRKDLAFVIERYSWDVGLRNYFRTSSKQDS